MNLELNLGKGKINVQMESFCSTGVTATNYQNAKKEESLNIILHKFHLNLIM